MKETKLKFKIAGISVDEKSLDWTVKIKSLDCLSAVRNSYAMSIVIDEDYFADRIGDLKAHISRVEKEPDLFDNAKNEIANTKDSIKAVEDEKEELRKKETGEFVAVVHSADFDKDILTITLPEENLLQVVAIRRDAEAFIVNLK